MTWSICIFAHNEERLLPRCLAAIEPAAAGAAYVAHVLENGSADGTARVAKVIAAADPRVRLHEIALGDKANAWNEYVHRIAPPDASMHVFLDGDVQPSTGALRALAATLEAAPEAWAAAALPATGRSRRSWAKRFFDETFLSGNLYALSGDAARLLRERKIRFPVGAVGEDGLLSYILLTDMKGGRDDGHKGRIEIASDAFFEFDPLALNLRDLRLYRRRLQRYSKRYFQNAILYDLLKERGLSALPERIDAIFTRDRLAPLRPRLSLENFLVDRAILKTLRDVAKA